MLKNTVARTVVLAAYYGLAYLYLVRLPGVACRAFCDDECYAVGYLVKPEPISISSGVPISAAGIGSGSGTTQV